MTFELHAGQIVIRDSGGAIRWRGKPDGFPAKAILPLTNSEDAVVLLDRMAGPKNFANVIRLAPDGRTLWRLSPPEPSMPDAWVQCEWVGDDMYANSWSGYRVQIDLATGRPSRSEFVK